MGFVVVVFQFIFGADNIYLTLKKANVFKRKCLLSAVKHLFICDY